MREKPDPDVTKVHFDQRRAVELSLRAPPALREKTDPKIQSELNETSSGRHLEWQCSSPGCREGISARDDMVE